MNQPFQPPNYGQQGFTYYSSDIDGLYQKCTVGVDGFPTCSDIPSSEEPKAHELVCKYNLPSQSSDVFCYTYDFYKSNFIPKKITGNTFSDENIDSINKYLSSLSYDPFSTPSILNNIPIINKITPNNSSWGNTVTLYGNGFLNNKSIVFLNLPENETNNAYITYDFKVVSDNEIIFNISDLYNGYSNYVIPDEYAVILIKEDNNKSYYSKVSKNTLYNVY